MVNNWTSSTSGLQLITRPQSPALPTTPEGCSLPPYVQNLCSTEIRAQLLMVLPLLLCVRGKGIHNFMVVQSRGLVRVGEEKTGDQKVAKMQQLPP